MYFKNCSIADMEKALELTNAKFDNNVVFKRIETQGQRILATLTVKNANKKNGSVKGARLGRAGLMGYGTIHHIASACWHVHGEFFDNLLHINNKAVITTHGRSIYENEYGTIEGNWEDWNIGSIRIPVYYACDC